LTESAVKLNEVDPKEMLKEWAGSAIHFDRLNHEKKLKFVDSCFRYWPNVSRICASVCISTAVYYLHLKTHPDFAEFMKAVDVSVTDDVEMVMRYEATNPKSFLDRMAYLRAHRPELYDRAKVVKIEGYKMNAQERSSRLGAVEAAVDATIVQAYSTRKERQQAKRLKAAERGEGLGNGGDGG
jgi:hypothetical protein